MSEGLHYLALEGTLGALRRLLNHTLGGTMPSSKLTDPSFALRNFNERDATQVLEIYQQGIETGHATFAQTAPSWKEWDEGHLPTCRIAALEDELVVGWAGLSSVSERCVYGGVAEVSVYVRSTVAGRGVGRSLLMALIAESERQRIWTLQAGIFPENNASIGLHKACGFRIVGTREKLGRMSHGPFEGQWRDVVLMERRSEKTGQD